MSIALLHGVRHLRGQVVSKATRNIHRRGVNELQYLANLLEVNFFPCSETLLQQLIVYTLVVRVPSLDASTVRLVLNATSA